MAYWSGNSNDNPTRCPHCLVNGRNNIKKKGYERWYCNNCYKEIKKSDLIK